MMSVLATIPEGSAIGRIEIPRIGVSAVIAEGEESATLRLAVGHIPGTALPGRNGNIGLAGHRDSFFRPLGRIRLQDEVRLTVEGGDVSVYRVDSIAVVDPANVGVLEPGPVSSVTLVTCFPFGYLGPAPRRFVVRARRVPF
jgi:sortase A